MYEGGDGFDAFKRGEVIVTAEMGMMLCSILRAAFIENEILLKWKDV